VPRLVGSSLWGRRERRGASASLTVRYAAHKDCVYCHATGGTMLTEDLTPGADTETATLAWLVDG
jgi:hypothetical protein